MICMKKVFITMGLIGIAILSFAQSSNDIRVLSYERPIGKILVTQEEIKAKEYIFPELIYDSYMDTISKSITVQLRGKNIYGWWMNRGNLVYYDLTAGRIKWLKDINYIQNSIQHFGSTIIISTINNKSYLLNNENGKRLGKAKNSIYFADPVANIYLGYKTKNSNELEGIDLKTGKTIWKRELNKEFGWNEMFRLKDSVLMIVAAGLHTVNVHDGSGWSYKAKTGEKDYTATIVGNAVGITLGLLTGFGSITTGHDLVRDIVSNVYSDNTSFYFASKERISRINKNDGKVIWSYQFPQGLQSNSFIWAKDNQIFMINYGYAFSGRGEQIYCGTPFFSAFNKENGELIFSHTFNEKKNPILDFKIENDHIVLIFKDRIIKCSLFDGSIIFETSINSNEFGELQRFVGNHIYIDETNSSLTNLLLSDVSKSYITTSKDNVLIFDAEFNVVGDFNSNQLYRTYAYLKEDYKLVVKGKDNQKIVIDADNKKIAELDITHVSFMVGNKLYSMQDKSFFEIDLTNLRDKREESDAEF